MKRKRSRPKQVRLAHRRASWRSRSCQPRHGWRPGVIHPHLSGAPRAEPAPANLRLLLEILDDRDRDRLLASPGLLEFACEFWTRPEQLDRWVYQVLEAKCPGIQVRKCRVVSVGLHEPTAIKATRSQSRMMHRGVSCSGWIDALASGEICLGVADWVADRSAQVTSAFLRMSMGTSCATLVLISAFLAMASTPRMYASGNP